MSEINANTPMKDMTIGGNIYENERYDNWWKYL